MSPACARAGLSRYFVILEIHVMIDSIALNIFLLLAFLLTLWENRITIDEKQIRNTKINVSLPTLLIILILGFLFTLLFLINGPRDIVQTYMVVAIGFLNIANSLWVTINKQGVWKIAGIFFSLFIIFLWIVFPSFLTHNTFLLFAIPWIGPLFTKLHIITAKRFIVIAVLLLLYDIVYVWLTPLSDVVQTTTSAARIPLGLYVGGYVLGAGDILFASIALCLLKKRSIQIGAIVLFIGTNIMLDVYSEYIKALTVFPMLVLWAPIAILLLIRLSWGKEQRGAVKDRARS